VGLRLCIVLRCCYRHARHPNLGLCWSRDSGHCRSSSTRQSRNNPPVSVVWAIMACSSDDCGSPTGKRRNHAIGRRPTIARDLVVIGAAIVLPSWAMSKLRVPLPFPPRLSLSCPTNRKHIWNTSGSTHMSIYAVNTFVDFVLKTSLVHYGVLRLLSYVTESHMIESADWMLSAIYSYKYTHSSTTRGAPPSGMHCKNYAAFRHPRITFG